MNQPLSKSPEGGSRRIFWIIFGLSLALFIPFAWNGFFSDDWDVISHLAFGGPGGMWTHPPTQFFRPTVASTLWCSFELGGWHSWAFNIPNYLLNAVNAGLVFLVAKAFLRRLSPSMDLTTKNAVGSFAALLCLAAPSNVEAIFFISDRGDLFAALAILSSTLVFLSALDYNKPALIWGILPILAFGCFSKESTYAMFLFFAAIAILDRKDKAKARIAWMTSAGAFLVTIGEFAIRSREVSAALPYGTGSHLGTELMKAVPRLAMMLLRPDFPIDFSIVLGHSKPPLTSLDWIILLVVLGLFGTVANFLFRCKPSSFEKPGILPPLAAFCASGAAVCFLAMKLLSPENGRLMYPPSAFAAIIFALILAPYFSRPQVRVGAVVLVVCGVLFTFLNGTLYRAEGDSCKAAVAWFQSHQPSPGETVILVPDSTGGRPIWRNGLPGALETMAPQWAKTPQVGFPYVDANEVKSMVASGKFDIGNLTLSDNWHVGIPKSTLRLEHANLIIVSTDGSTEQISGVDIQLPDPQHPNGKA